MVKVPVFQASKLITSGVWTGTDYDYPVGIDAARASQADGYSIDCVAFVAEDTVPAGWMPFRRYMRSNFHFYSTFADGENLTGWTPTPAIKTASMQANSRPHTTGMLDVKRYWSDTSQTGVAHFYSADPAITPVPPGFVLEPSGTNHTGWVYPATRVEFQVTYNGNGDRSGITVTGGNATGQTISVGGVDYVMRADDALVAYGVGNWVRFNKNDTNNWHIADVLIVPENASTPVAEAHFDKLPSNDDSKLAIVDNDEDATNSAIAYKYTLQVYDVARDKVIDYDPKIINRAPAVSH